ncbi:MAG TPA: DUF669 domain-containing protein [Phycisphaerae bacterium]|nr:DUF669 domain-containing protein [Phycisphaerae bacterium]
MANLGNFNANDVEPTSFDPLPAGKYLAVITESEMKATKSGAGQFLNLTFQVLDGEHKGRKLWARLNLKNPNPQAEQIARGQLSAICRAVGVMAPRDSVELHNLPLVVTVKLKKRDDTGDLQNEISGYSKKDAAPAAPAPAAAASSTPPWKR